MACVEAPDLHPPELILLRPEERYKYFGFNSMGYFENTPPVDSLAQEILKQNKLPFPILDLGVSGTGGVIQIGVLAACLEQSFRIPNVLDTLAKKDKNELRRGVSLEICQVDNLPLVVDCQSDRDQVTMQFTLKPQEIAVTPEAIDNLRFHAAQLAQVFGVESTEIPGVTQLGMKGVVAKVKRRLAQ